jgi:CDP-glycerol glycerophosphotransferase (TagB/SpsB family)
MEIIFIDDGSDDGSWELIQKFQKEHGNIKSIRQWRERQGAARNKGMNLCTGDYIAFLDSDDTVPNNAYKKMYDLARSNDSDMVVGIQRSFSKVRRWVGVPVHQKKFHTCIENTSVDEFPELLTDISVCNKLFKRTSLVENNITFPEQKAGEDLEFVAKSLLVFRKISVVPEIVYNYRARENTSTGRLSTDFFKERVNTTICIGELYKSHGKENLFQYVLISELRKLVGNRLDKVILQSNDEDKNIVLRYIKKLTDLIVVEQLTMSDMIEDIDRIKILLIKDSQFEELSCLANNKLNEKNILPENHGLYSKLVNSLWQNHIKKDSVLIALKNRGAKAALQLVVKKTKKKVRPNYYKLRNICKALLTLNLPKILCVLKYFMVSVDIRSYLKPENEKANVWLIDERWAQGAEDNSYWFFIYLRQNFPELPVFYVIDPNSKKSYRVYEYGNVVRLFSLDHMKLLRNAKALMSTDGFKALAYPYEVFPFLRRKTLNIFLQHGVSGNKTTSYYKERYSYFNLVVTNNENERRAFIDVYGFDEDEVVVTGFPRFDQLPLEPQNKKIRKILVAPTWRKWLKRKSKIKDSIYYKSWNNLLTSKRLVSLLENNGIQLIFHPHFNMMKYLNQFTSYSENIQIIHDPHESLQFYIINSDVLITDYSSVMYDFFYQLKPVLSFMFDLEDWNRPPNGPSLVDFEKELPVDIFYEVNNLIDALEFMIGDYKYYDSVNRAKVKNIFTCRDHNNSSRLFNLINDRQN